MSVIRLDPRNRDRPICQGKLTPYVSAENQYREEGIDRLHPIYGELSRRKIQRRKDKGLKPDQCGVISTYRIDDQYFCKKHGAFFLIDKLAVDE